MLRLHPRVSRLGTQHSKHGRLRNTHSHITNHTSRGRRDIFHHARRRRPGGRPPAKGAVRTRVDERRWPPPGCLQRMLRRAGTGRRGGLPGVSALCRGLSSPAHTYVWVHSMSGTYIFVGYNGNGAFSSISAAHRRTSCSRQDERLSGYSFSTPAAGKGKGREGGQGGGSGEDTRPTIATHTELGAAHRFPPCRRQIQPHSRGGAVRRGWGND